MTFKQWCKCDLIDWLVAVGITIGLTIFMFVPVGIAGALVEWLRFDLGTASLIGVAIPCSAYAYALFKGCSPSDP